MQETPSERYKKKLQTPWWKAYRREVIRLFGYKCNRCGITDEHATLQVHHRRYINGLEPWQYRNPRDIEVLCKDCHRREHNIEPEPFKETEGFASARKILKGIECKLTNS